MTPGAGSHVGSVCCSSNASETIISGTSSTRSTDCCAGIDSRDLCAFTSSWEHDEGARYMEPCSSIWVSRSQEH